MADYWKSQPRKFCQYCKCWIADNKPSVDFHERGKNHKENVAAKIAEIRKKSVQKAKQDKKMCKQFATMEEAAAKAYEEDLKRMGLEGGTSFGPEVDLTSTTSPYQPESTEQTQKPPQTSKQGPKQKPPEPKPPVQLPPHPQHPPYPPYPQHIPQHIPRRNEAALWVEAMSNEGHIYYYNRLSGESRWDKPEGFKGINDAPPPPGTTEISTVCSWMEAVSPEGHTYYYNTVTGASSWEKPAEYIPKAAPGSTEQGEGQGEPSNAEQAEEEKEEEATSEQPSTGTTEQGSQESTVPKVQFRKRKAEADSSEETSEAAEDTPKEEEKDQNEESGTTEPEMKEEKDETPTGRFRPRNPYGTWERIKMQKDPYKSVDWQLPQVQAGEDTVALELPPEPKHKFKTRVITSLGDSASSSGPVSFKKKKTQNGKSRSLRQRDEDD